jgi:hypothetical protein
MGVLILENTIKLVDGNLFTPVKSDLGFPKLYCFMFEDSNFFGGYGGSPGEKG